MNHESFSKNTSESLVVEAEQALHFSCTSQALKQFFFCWHFWNQITLQAHHSAKFAAHDMIDMPTRRCTAVFVPGSKTADPVRHIYVGGLESFPSPHPTDKTAVEKLFLLEVLTDDCCKITHALLRGNDTPTDGVKKCANIYFHCGPQGKERNKIASIRAKTVSMS